MRFSKSRMSYDNFVKSVSSKPDFFLYLSATTVSISLFVLSIFTSSNFSNLRVVFLYNNYFDLSRRINLRQYSGKSCAANTTASFIMLYMTFSVTSYELHRWTVCPFDSIT